MMLSKLHSYNLRGIFYITSIFSMCSSLSIAQIQSPYPQVKLEISQSQFANLQQSKGAKLKLNRAIMTMDGDTAIIKDIHLRGNNTLNFKRKSFSIDLEKSIHLTVGDAKVSLKKFHLLNLAMDKNLWHNRWSYIILNELGLFPSFNSFCTVSINGNSQGIYLLVEKPQHAAEALHSPYTIRRGIKHAIDHDYVETKSKDEVKQYKEQYSGLYKTKSIHGEALHDHLSKALNINLYFRWLAFNYLIMNGDYADELFLYIHPDTKRFDVIAWDYDDLFMVSPHEGREVRNQQYKERMIFSLEDALDQTIAGDDFVYQKYEGVLKEVLLLCNDEMLLRAAEKVLNELTELNSDPENGLASLYVDKEPFVLEDARYDIGKSIEYLKNRRALVLKELK